MHTRKGRTAQNLLGERCCCCCCGFVPDFLLGSPSWRIFNVAAATRLSRSIETFSFWCSLVQRVLSLVHITLCVLKYHIQNINFTIMNIIAITVFIHFSPLLLLRTYMVLRFTCVYHYTHIHIRQISNQIKEKGRKVHQREKTKEWKTKWV